MHASLVKERILLIGPDGQVGHAVAALLRSKQIPFVVAGLTVENVPTSSYRLDLTDLNSLERIVREVKPTIVINPAAYTAVDKAESEKELALTINAKAPEVLGQICGEIGAFVIHYSTDYVFDGSGMTPRDENAIPHPINYYGTSKREGEIALERSGVNHVVLRTSWVFSEVGQNFVKTMLKLGQDREELRVVSDQVGAPTSANMLALATMAVAEKVAASSDRGKSFSGIYHCCCAGETNWHEFAGTIFKMARASHQVLKINVVTPIMSVEYPTPAKRPLNSRLNCSKFIQTFGYRPPSWQSELQSTVDHLVQ